MEVTPFDHMILVAIPHVLRRVTSYINDISVYIYIYDYIYIYQYTYIIYLTLQITREFISFLNAQKLPALSVFACFQAPQSRAQSRHTRRPSSETHMARSRGVVA